MAAPVTHAGDRRVARAAAWVIGVVVAALAVTIGVGFAPVVRARLGLGATPASTAYAVGERIDVPAQLYGQSDQTLIVFAAGTCSACNRSASLLGGIAAQLRHSSTAFVMLTPDTRLPDQQGLQDRMGLADAEVAHLNLTGYKVQAVPTVVLVDRTGRVRFVHEGLVDLVAQGRIQQAIGDRGVIESRGRRGAQ